MTVTALSRRPAKAPAMKILFAASLFVAALVASAGAQEPVAPRLEAFAVLPADETVRPPADAPAYFRRSGRFTAQGAARTETLGAVPAAGGAPALPMQGQPVQGISAILANPDGTVWGLSDNGFGGRANSADALLMVHRFRIDWESGDVRRVETIFLSDPDAIAPFPLVSETHARRYLTGRDFDPESIAPRAGGGFWIGDEFGPFLLEVDARGRLLSVTSVRAAGQEVRSPDHWQGADGAVVGRSKGLEGMGHSADGRFLYPMLEGPVRDAQGAPETDEQGRTALRILEFDTVSRAFTGREWLYPLADPNHAIGDITILAPGEALVIERDSAQGEAAQFKRIVRITMPEEGGLVVPHESLDLLAIADPGDLSGGRGANGVFRFPFVTIESVARLDNGDLLIVNDNNYPFSAGRNPTRPDDTEWIRIRPAQP